MHDWEAQSATCGEVACWLVARPYLLPAVRALPDLMECADDQGDGAGMLSRAVAEAAMSPLEMTHSGNAVDAAAPKEST